MNNNEGAKGIILEAIKIAQELAAEDEARLGRPLTDAEVGAIATFRSSIYWTVRDICGYEIVGFGEFTLGG